MAASKQGLVLSTTHTKTQETRARARDWPSLYRSNSREVTMKSRESHRISVAAIGDGTGSERWWGRAGAKRAAGAGAARAGGPARLGEC